MPTSVLGLHVAAGVAWIAQVDDQLSLVPDRVDRLSLEAGALSEERALSELEESLEGLLGRTGVRSVALLSAGKAQRPPSPADSRRRGWIEAAAMIAASRTNTTIAFVSHDDVEKIFGMRPSEASFPKESAKRLDGAPPACWKTRAPAFAAATTVLSNG